MRAFGITFHLPDRHLWLVVAGWIGGLVIGSVIQLQTHGSRALVLGLAAAGAVTAFTTLAGADLDAGRRGVVFTAGAAFLTFVVVSALGLARAG